MGSPRRSNTAHSTTHPPATRKICVIRAYNTGIRSPLTPGTPIIAAIAKAAADTAPVRFIQVGNSSGSDIALPGAALRSSPIVLMGSGLKSVPMPRLLASIKSVFEAFAPAGFTIKTRPVPLSEVAEAWHDNGKARVVFVLP